MPVDEHIFQSLLDMGIDAPLARAASERFSTPDAAVDWCFGPGGQNVGVFLTQDFPSHDPLHLQIYCDLLNGV